jgi:glucosamine 6-phosphate synthetase-like amidotransferase/phosphosugar isomerase protein
VLIDGIRRLEYRGYDSTGLALVENVGADARLARIVSTARVADLAAQTEARSITEPPRVFRRLRGLSQAAKADSGC